MRIKIILTSLLIIILGGFFANWQYGISLSNKIDQRIKSNPLITKNFKSFSYSKIEVCPITAEVTFYDLEITDDYVAKGKEVVIKMTYAEARELAATNNLKQLTKLGVIAKTIEIEKNNKSLSISNLTLRFKGLFKSDFKQDILDHSQKINLLIEDLKGNDNLFDELNWNPEEDSIQLLKINMISNAAKQRIKLNEIELVSTLVNSNWEGTYFYDEALNPKKVKFSGKTISCNKPINYGSINTIGSYGIEKLNTVCTGELFLDDKINIDGSKSKAKIKLSLSGASLQFNKETRRVYSNRLSLLGISIDDIRITDLQLNGNIDNGDLSIFNTKLKSPLLNAKIKSLITCDFIKPDNSIIKTSELKIDITQPNLKGSLEGVERIFGLNIPRSGNDIIVELKGPLKKPLIKGVHYK